MAAIEGGPISELAAAWLASGLRAPVASLPRDLNQVCVISDCEGMSFVRLRVDEGLRSVCFQHFQALQAISQAGSSPSGGSPRR